MRDWLIIGGGPHGAFAARAIQDAAPNSAIAILDPQGPLAAWQRRATACGMQYLRSSNAHHLGRRADALRRFAAAHGFDAAHELGYYRRPSRDLFEAHARDALAGPRRIRTSARAIERDRDGWRIVADDGRVHHARRVVLATGPNPPYRPSWAGGVDHVYDPGFALAPAGTTPRRVAVVGSGISGAQLALRAAALGHAVCWITRGTPQRADFDSDPCYAGPRCLAPFAATPLAERTALLAAARQPGTLPPDIHARITTALADGQIGWRRGAIVDSDGHDLIFDDGRRLTTDRVILATGFTTHPPANSLLGRTIAALGACGDDAGHGMINDALEAAPGLHLLGRPASLQLGPMAPNIKGARLGGQRLAALARREAARAA